MRKIYEMPAEIYYTEFSIKENNRIEILDEAQNFKSFVFSDDHTVITLDFTLSSQEIYTKFLAYFDSIRYGYHFLQVNLDSEGEFKPFVLDMVSGITTNKQGRRLTASIDFVVRKDITALKTSATLIYFNGVEDIKFTTYSARYNNTTFQGFNPIQSIYSGLEDILFQAYPAAIKKGYNISYTYNYNYFKGIKGITLKNYPNFVEKNYFLEKYGPDYGDLLFTGIVGISFQEYVERIIRQYELEELFTHIFQGNKVHKEGAFKDDQVFNYILTGFLHEAAIFDYKEYPEARPYNISFQGLSVPLIDFQGQEPIKYKKYKKRLYKVVTVFFDYIDYLFNNNLVNEEGFFKDHLEFQYEGQIRNDFVLTFSDIQLQIGHTGSTFEGQKDIVYELYTDRTNRTYLINAVNSAKIFFNGQKEIEYKIYLARVNLLNAIQGIQIPIIEYTGQKVITFEEYVSKLERTYEIEYVNHSKNVYTSQKEIKFFEYLLKMQKEYKVENYFIHVFKDFKINKDNKLIDSQPFIYEQIDFTEFDYKEYEPIRIEFVLFQGLRIPFVIFNGLEPIEYKEYKERVIKHLMED